MTISKGDSPQFALDRLDPNRITFAREWRGLTKKELAKSIKKTPSAISQIERGLISPDLETFISISFSLKVPPSFFIERSVSSKSIDMSTCHFRSLRSTSQAMRRQSARKGDLWIDLIEILGSKGVIFPEEQISNFQVSSESDDHIENIAIDLRRHWKMGLGPIPNIVKLLESKGILVLPLHDAVEKVDAYSTWRGNQPCMFVSYQKSASRIRFDVSHELGHLAMHEDLVTGDAMAERQANRFAGAFLAPKESFLEECPRSWSYAAFARLKDRWKLSIQALLYRAKELGRISTSTHRRAMIQLSNAGMRKDEGDEWEKEKPVMVTQALELLKDQITLDELADKLSIYINDLRDILCQCVPMETLNKIDRRIDADSATIVRFRKMKHSI
ncbi:helix-turn-helix domain-containing protein [Desulfosarcina widdelii]|uniref:helix-turn-helix domain-containing protein n=1 Tax=Desulfosarcina widdelii TaxID=947919 RepID=UPI0012D2E19A|nr:ImmA/IrrE family metallo-endopeptidase [Desulfosarcina widdelii]